MAYAQFRPVPTSRFQNKLTINAVEQVNATGFLGDDPDTFETHTIPFAYQADGLQPKGEIEDQSLEQSGLLRDEDSLSVVVRFSKTLRDLFRDRNKKLSFILNGENYRLTEFQDVDRQGVYFSLVLKQVDYAA